MVMHGKEAVRPDSPATGTTEPGCRAWMCIPLQPASPFSPILAVKQQWVYTLSGKTSLSPSVDHPGNRHWCCGQPSSHVSIRRPQPRVKVLWCSSPQRTFEESSQFRMRPFRYSLSFPIPRPTATPPPPPPLSDARCKWASSFSSQSLSAGPLVLRQKEEAEGEIPSADTHGV